MKLKTIIKKIDHGKTLLTPEERSVIMEEMERRGKEERLRAWEFDKDGDCE